MKIGLQTWGTDGDFYPFLALAIGLSEAGHEVTLAHTSVDGKDHSYNPYLADIKFIDASIGSKFDASVNPYAIDAKAGSFKEYSKLLNLYFDPFVDAMYKASEQLCQKNDLVIGHAACITLHTAALKHKCPCISLVLTPLVVQSKYISPIGVNLGSVLNSMMWWMGDRVSTAQWFRSAQALHQQEGLPPIRSLQHEVFRSPLLTLVAASPQLCPRQNDWPSNVQMTGFLNMKPAQHHWNMPSELKSFLEAGEAPIYMTFGSCMAFDVEASTRLLVDAAKLSGKRAIIQSHWDQLDIEPDSNIYRIAQAPHSELFPYCSLIVHHGGAGTTQAALLAGRPSVVVAHGFDQPYWGNQLKAAKVGGKVFLRKNTSASGLAAEINRISASSTVLRLASVLGESMQAENGVSLATHLISDLSI